MIDALTVSKTVRLFDLCEGLGTQMQNVSENKCAKFEIKIPNGC